MRAGRDVRDDVELLSRLRERALEREVVVGRHDELVRRSALAQQRWQPREQACRARARRPPRTGVELVVQRARTASSRRTARARQVDRPVVGHSRSRREVRGQVAGAASPSTGRPGRRAVPRRARPSRRSRAGAAGAARAASWRRIAAWSRWSRGRARSRARRPARARPDRHQAPRPAGRSDRARASGGARSARAADARRPAIRARRRPRCAARSRSASIRSSSARRRSSSSRRISACANVVREVGERRATPERQARSRSCAPLLGGQLGARRRRALEAGESIWRARGGALAGRPGLEHVGAEQLARREKCSAATSSPWEEAPRPTALDQTVRRYDPPALEQQQASTARCLWPPRGSGPLLVRDLERAQEPEFELGDLSHEHLGFLVQRLSVEHTSRSSCNRPAGGFDASALKDRLKNARWRAVGGPLPAGWSPLRPCGP